MMKERSIGIILFTKENKEIKYLLLYRKPHENFKESWDFVKGNVEEKESELETLKRELIEETGISDFNLTKNFKERIKLFYKRDNQTIFKEIIFYLGETKIKDIKLSYEHDSYKWCNYEEALQLLTHKNSKNIFKKANERLRSSLLNF